MKTYTLNEKEYHLHYSIGRMEQIEKILGNSVTGMMMAIANNHYPSISELTTLFSYGLLSENGEYAPLKLAKLFAQQQLQENGYLAMLNDAMEQIQEDCGFLFQ